MPRYGLEQVAQVRALAFVGDDGAADEQQPAHAGLAHRLHDAAGTVLAERVGTGAVRGDGGGHHVGIRHCWADRGRVHDVGCDDLQPRRAGTVRRAGSQTTAVTS